MTDTCPTCGSDRREVRNHRHRFLVRDDYWHYHVDEHCDTPSTPKERCPDPWHDQPDTDAVEAALRDLAEMVDISESVAIEYTRLAPYADRIRSTITALRAENERLRKRYDKDSELLETLRLVATGVIPSEMTDMMRRSVKTLLAYRTRDAREAVRDE